MASSVSFCELAMEGSTPGAHPCNPSGWIKACFMALVSFVPSKGIELIVRFAVDLTGGFDSATMRAASASSVGIVYAKLSLLPLALAAIEELFVERW
jgi:hypothetical protein